MFSSRSLLVALLVLGLAVGVDASALVIEWSVGSIIGLIILILDILVIVEIVRSNRDMFMKAIWIIVVLLFPILGLIIYCCCARKHGDHQEV